jgi:hypothetical protein
MHMSNAISITMLYSYNLCADTFAERQPNSRGKSQICGDDCIRAGNGIYIDAYKRKIEQYGGIWSSTKDTTGRNGKGLFTELYFSEGTILTIPRAKVICKPSKGDNIPLWKKAVQSARKIAETYSILVERELLYPFKPDIKFYKQFLPLSCDQRLGGLGMNQPLPWPVQTLMDGIKTLKDPAESVRMMNKLMSPIRADGDNPQTQGKLKISPFRATDLIVGDNSYYQQKKAKWIYLEERRLRSAIEDGCALSAPPKPIRFKTLTQNQEVIKYTQLLNSMNIELTEAGIIPKLGKIPSTEDWIRDTYRADVPTRIVSKIIGPEAPNFTSRALVDQD